MKVNHRQGHSVNCRGAKKYSDEVDVCSAVNKEFGGFLSQLGIKGIDCTSTERTINGDLNYGINKNNANKADYYVPIHANAGGGQGAEIWLYPNPSSETKNKATAMLKNLEELGFRNRGIKYSSSLADLKRTNNKAILVELFFVDTKSDCDLYNKVGAKKIAKALAEGISGKTIQEPQQPQAKYRILCYGMSEARAKEGCEILRKYGNFKCNYEKM